MQDKEETPSETIRVLWQEHEAARFPAKLRGRDLDGVDFVMLDADIAGCVDSFMKHSKLTVFQAATLGLCYHNSSQVISVLYEEGAEYFWRLSRLAELILREVVSTELTKIA